MSAPDDELLLRTAHRLARNAGVPALPSPRAGLLTHSPWVTALPGRQGLRTPVTLIDETLPPGKQVLAIEEATQEYLRATGRACWN